MEISVTDKNGNEVHPAGAIRSIIDENKAFRARLAEVEAQRDMFAAIGKEFCERAERGEIRSKYTYRKLKEALAKLEARDE
jgi:hypothetical protein